MNPTPNNAKLSIPEPNLGLYQANLSLLGQDMARLLADNPETPIGIDPDLQVSGLKNPIYLVIIGFSTKNVLEAARKHNKEIAHVLIIEPDLKKFHQTIRREYIGDLLSSQTIDILVGIAPDEVLPHIQKIFTHADPKSGSRATKCFAPEIVTDPFAYPPQDGKIHPVAQQISQAVVDASKQEIGRAHV